VPLTSNLHPFAACSTGRLCDVVMRIAGRGPYMPRLVPAGSALQSQVAAFMQKPFKLLTERPARMEVSYNV
jgi:hypothetical protein